jgi:hypothetical protein
MLVPGNEVTGGQAFPECGRELLCLDFHAIKVGCIAY